MMQFFAKISLRITFLFNILLITIIILNKPQMRHRENKLIFYKDKWLSQD